MLETSETSEYFLHVLFFRGFGFEYWTEIAKSKEKKSEKNSEVWQDTPKVLDKFKKEKGMK